jgi:hypothetical protein
MSSVRCRTNARQVSELNPIFERAKVVSSYRSYRRIPDTRRPPRACDSSQTSLHLSHRLRARRHEHSHSLSSGIYAMMCKKGQSGRGSHTNNGRRSARLPAKSPASTAAPQHSGPRPHDSYYWYPINIVLIPWQPRMDGLRMSPDDAYENPRGHDRSARRHRHRRPFGLPKADQDPGSAPGT